MNYCFRLRIQLKKPPPAPAGDSSRHAPAGPCFKSPTFLRTD
jgi:hypothetical protein